MDVLCPLSVSSRFIFSSASLCIYFKWLHVRHSNGQIPQFTPTPLPPLAQLNGAHQLEG